MRRNDKVALIVLSIAMVVGGLYLLSVVSAWFWAITLSQWAITVLWAIDDHAKPLKDKVSWSSMRERPPFQKPQPYAK